MPRAAAFSETVEEGDVSAPGQDQRRVDLVGEDPGLVLGREVGERRELRRGRQTAPVGLWGLQSSIARAPPANARIDRRRDRGAAVAERHLDQLAARLRDER